MAALNKVLLIGNLTKDPELRYTPSGQAVCSFRIAISRNWTGKDGQKNEETTFLTIKVWGKQGETCGQYLKKGRPVFVEGRIQTRDWQGEDGQKRYATDIVADRVQFLGSRDGAGGGGGGGGAKGGARDDSDPFAGEDEAPVEDDIPF